MNYTHSWYAAFNPGKAYDYCMADNPPPFNAHQKEFSMANAWWLSEISRLIYVRNYNLKKGYHQISLRKHYLSRLGLEEKWSYDGKRVQCAGISSNDRQNPFSVLVFRGTQRGVINFCFNLITLFSSWPAGGYVHKGYKTLLLDVWDDIHNLVRLLKRPIFFTGHSLGGALAVLASTLYLPEGVYTFGGPKLAHPSFLSTTKDIDIYRIENGSDIVPSFPPLPGMVHVGCRQHFSVEPLHMHSRLLLDAPSFIADHSPSNYSYQLLYSLNKKYQST